MLVNPPPLPPVPPPHISHQFLASPSQNTKCPPKDLACDSRTPNLVSTATGAEHYTVLLNTAEKGQGEAAGRSLTNKLLDFRIEHLMNTSWAACIT